MFKRKRNDKSEPSDEREHSQEIGPLFTVKYTGTCAVCDQDIQAGDKAGKVYLRKRRIGKAVADDPYWRMCCERCHQHAAKHGDPSRHW